MASSTKQLEDGMLCRKILDYKVGEYEEFHDALEGEMEGCCVNIALFGMTGSGKSALINTIFQSLNLDSQPAITQSTGKEGTIILDSYALPGRKIALYDTRGFFELDMKEEGELFRILFGIERSGDDLTRDNVSAQKAAAAGVGAHRLKKPPIVDQMHVVLWVIKANDVRFQKGQYREIIKFVQDQLKQAIITVITVITFDDEIQKNPNADEERERLREAAIEVTGSDKRNVFMIANSVPGRQGDHGSVYKKRVLKMLEQALKCGERSIRMRQTIRESPKKQPRSDAEHLKHPIPVENDEDWQLQVCLFNCDGTYKLDVVEMFLMETREKHGFKFSIDKRDFRLKEMAEVCESIPQLQMDYAIFVVHAEESRLSINEDDAGIGYAKIYRALLQATDDKVLIVIGGDDHYKDENEEEQFVISRWARRKVASQFNEEYLDGRKSFIFSWNKKHREIHEEALMHYFDPNKKGLKFEYQPKPKPKTEEPEVTPPAARDIQQESVVKDVTDTLLPKDENEAYSDQEEQKREFRDHQEQATSYGALNPAAGVDYPADTLLLDTHMRYGKISYKNKHIVKRQDNWQPTQKQVTDLMELHKSSRDAKVQFISEGDGGVHYTVVNTTPWWRRCCSCCYKCCCRC